MPFADRIRELASRLPDQLDHVQTEEATKSAMIMPFISALGYDVFSPTEVVPEFVADVGIKKGEKVDFAVMRENKPVILIECKKHGTDLDKVHASQLYRYFSTTEARFAILTDGLKYRFFSDLDKPNTMDSRYFFEFNILDCDDRSVGELKKFTKNTFNEEEILETASALKYVDAIKQALAQLWEKPNEDFVRFLASTVYDGRFTQSVREFFGEVVRKALREFLHERVKQRLKSALDNESRSISPVSDLAASDGSGEEAQNSEGSFSDKPGVVTTRDEIEAFYIIKSILRDVIDVARIELRDSKSYCSVLLDNNNRKPICRFHFGERKQSIGTFDENKTETKHQLADLDEIYKYAAELAAVVFHYDQGAAS